MAMEITAANFSEIVENSSQPVLVDFWATWCGPCRMLGPIVDEFAEQQEAVVVGKVNVDEQPALASKFGVMTIPTLILFKEGKEVDKSIGLISQDELTKFANQ